MPRIPIRKKDSETKTLIQYLFSWLGLGSVGRRELPILKLDLAFTFWILFVFMIVIMMSSYAHEKNNERTIFYRDQDFVMSHLKNTEIKLK